MKLAIYGYGNIGRGVEAAAKQNDDMEMVCVFTRRDPSTVVTKTGIPVCSADDILKYKDEIDVLIICGGSATDLPKMTPELAKNFNVVDSFDIDEEEKIVVALAASIMLGDGIPNPNLHIKKITRIS